MPKKKKKEKHQKNPGTLMKLLREASIKNTKCDMEPQVGFEVLFNIS